MLGLTHTAALAALGPVRSYLEIGVQEGASLRAVVGASPDLELLVLSDTWGTECGGTGRGSHAHVAAILDEMGYRGEVVYLDGPSQVEVPRYLASAGRRRFDLAYVDGHHGEPEALADMRNVWPACWRMAVHDLVFPDVWRACTRWMVEAHAEVAHAWLAAAPYNGLLIVDREV